jgi:glycosyltransferase involved in cell wall biosynthesis
MDVYVCSSISESSPASVWEAMSMARAIVSTSVGDVPCHISNGKSGYLVDVNDSAALGDRVIDLLMSPDLRTSFGQEARKAVDVFSPHTVGMKTEAFYKRVLQTNCM